MLLLNYKKLERRL